MDTKSRKFDKVGYTLYCISCVVDVAAITIALIAASAFFALEQMFWMQDYNPDEYTYAGTITNLELYTKTVDVVGVIMLVAGGIAVALLVCLFVMTGRFNKNDDNTYHLNWFDKVWTEVQLTAGFTAGCLAFLPLSYMYCCWLEGMYLGVWKWHNEYEGYSVGGNITFSLVVILEVLCIIIALACLLSVIKKIKARQFWGKSILGGIALFVYRGIKSSSKTLLKVMSILIVGSFLCATWFGLPLVLILIFMFVPKLVKKFKSIEVGVEEVKNGNLTYKIPVEVDSKGNMSEFDKLASSINDISQASNIAVQNEIKSQRMKTDLISNVSHDLKTPLTSMVSYICLLKQEGLDSPNAPEYLEILDNKTQRLKSLTENLFEAAKASSGAIPVNIETIDISSVLAQALAEMGERLETKGLDVQVKDECENHLVRADGQLLWRVLENLLGNVSKYALENSRVYINVSEHNVGNSGLAKIEIKNISKDALNISPDELTERFKRGDDSRNTEGSGLGLAIAKDLIKMMDGVFEIGVDGDLFKATVMLKKTDK